MGISVIERSLERIREFLAMAHPPIDGKQMVYVHDIESILRDIEG